MAAVKYRLPDLKVRQNEVVRFRKSACPLLSCALIIQKNLSVTIRRVSRVQKEEKKKKKTLKSFKLLGLSRDCYGVNNLALRRLICFRFDRRDVVTTRSVCGHLCHRQWHSANGFVGNVVF